MIYLELFLTFFKIGLFTFGGGYAMLPLIQEEVAKHQWLDANTLIDFVAVSESTPGPFAINIATYLGNVQGGLTGLGPFFGGLLGSACATLGVVMPSFIVILIVAGIYEKFKKSRIVKGVMSGLKPAVIGLIGAAMITLAPPAIMGSTRLGTGLAAKLGSGIGDVLANTPLDFVAIAMVAATVVLIAKFKKSPIFVLLIMGCIGALIGV